MTQTLLETRWIALCQRLGIATPEQKWAILAANYQAEGRSYHTLRHVAQCLALFDQYRTLVADLDLVEYAFWMHDVVYDPKRADNEALSAEMARAWLAQDVCSASIVSANILATQHPSAPIDPDQQFMVDVDLAILGAPRSVYADYFQAVRREYAWVPDQAFQVGRGKVLEDFLARSRIYSRPELIDLWEQQARLNMQWELEYMRGID